MNKQELAAMLEKEKNRFHNIYGGETVLYAEKDPHPKPMLNSFGGLRKPDNLRQAEWDKYLEEVKAGTYTPQQEPEKQYKPVKKCTTKPCYSTDPMWRF